MKPLIVIQARLGSSRLPGKVIMRIGQRTMFEQTRARATRSGRQVRSLISADDLWLFEVAFHADWAAAVPEDDVLARFFYGTVDGGHDPIVRITADCPLIDPAVIKRALDEYDGTRLVCSTQGPDYEEGYPDGQDVEVFSREMLEEAFAKTDDLPKERMIIRHPDKPDEFVYGRDECREHPTLWMRENCDVHYLDHVPACKIKLSVDTWDDLQFVRRIVKDLGPDCTLEEIYEWAAAREAPRQTAKP